MKKSSSLVRAKGRAPLKRAVHRSMAKTLGITLPPIGAPVPLPVKKLAAIELQRRQAQAAIPALARLGAQFFRQAQAANCTPAERDGLIRQSQQAWQVSRQLRRCTQSLVTTYRRDEQQLSVQHTEACKFKLCPHCARTKSVKRRAELTAAVRAIKEAEPDAKFILLTLTKPKSTVATLAESLRRLSKNVRRLLATPQLRRIVRGYVAVIEINYDPDTETFHDHSHVLIHVPVEYGRERPDLWAEQSLLVKLWSALYATDQRLVVDVRFVRAADDHELAKSFAELCKYLTSPISLFKRDPDQPDLWTCHARPMMALAAATHRMRLMTCGGTLAKARRVVRATPRTTTSATEGDR